MFVVLIINLFLMFRVPTTKELVNRAVLFINELVNGTVPSNNEWVDGTVPSNNKFVEGNPNNAVF